MKSEATRLTTASCSSSSLCSLSSTGEGDSDGNHNDIISNNDEDQALPISPPPPEALSPPSCSDAASASAASFYRTLIQASVILAWYIISNTIILSTKWLFILFPFPLTVTVVANGIAFLWALGLTRIFPSLRPDQPLSRHNLLNYVLPIGLCTGLEISCSNLALKLLSISFGTILKGGGPIFTFCWGLLFGVERFRGTVAGCLITIALGIALASLGERGKHAEFQFVGFFLQLFASCLGGLRWAMTHKLLRDGNTHHKMSPLTAILYTTPATTLCVIPVALGIEAKTVWEWDSMVQCIALQDADSMYTCIEHPLLAVGSTLFGIATLIFILLMSEYWLVNATSSLAVSVAAVFKELLTIGGGIFFFAEHIDLLNVVGFMTCQCGILAYVYLRYHDKDGEHGSNYEPMPVGGQEVSHSLAMSEHEKIMAMPEGPPVERFVDEEQVELPEMSATHLDMT
jgi:solute carrier family 35 protein C2